MFGTLRFLNWINYYFNKEYFTYNGKVYSLIFIFIFLSLFIALICYLSIDPIKRCLYLVLSLILLTPYLSIINEVWYSYFVCIIFLRGIFVILVYFTSISKYIFHKLNASLLIITGLLFIPYLFISYSLTLNSLYFKDYILLFFFLLRSLIYFINFSSYFLNYRGALRKA